MRLIAIATLLLLPLAATAQDLLRSPKDFCGALAPLGIPTNGWKPSKANPNEWACMSTLIPFGTRKNGGMEGNIGFYVRSPAFDRADEIRLKININNPDDRELAFAKLESATGELFKALGKPLPPELPAALKQKKPQVIRTSFGQAELEFQPGRIESYVVVLKAASAIAAKTVAVQGGAREFSECKRVVAKAAGYSQTLLSGDGDPAMEPGYKSFMLKGQGKDIFFCEVHAAGRYKVKAALNGVFPFRYIADAAF